MSNMPKATKIQRNCEVSKTQLKCNGIQDSALKCKACAYYKIEDQNYQSIRDLQILHRFEWVWTCRLLPGFVLLLVFCFPFLAAQLLVFLEFLRLLLIVSLLCHNQFTMKFVFAVIIASLAIASSVPIPWKNCGKPTDVIKYEIPMSCVPITLSYADFLLSRLHLIACLILFVGQSWQGWGVHLALSARKT